jgi:hypothetical protein
MLAAGAVLVAACTRDPVQWSGEPSALASAAAPTPDASRLALDAEGRVSLAAAPGPSAAVAGPDVCATLVRYARRSAEEQYAAWWRIRSDGSAALVSARSDDGGVTWAPPVAVDTTDRTTIGCERPAPAIAAPPGSPYVHIAYSLAAPEGTGVFFAHSMDRGALYHAPVAIVYGDRQSATAIAAQGDTVVVAYENPNTTSPEVSLAISRRAGHIFEERLDVSVGAHGAMAPDVALRTPFVAVGWRPVTLGATAPPVPSGPFVVRLGRLR